MIWDLVMGQLGLRLGKKEDPAESEEAAAREGGEGEADGGEGELDVIGLVCHAFFLRRAQRECKKFVRFFCVGGEGVRLGS